MKRAWKSLDYSLVLPLMLLCIIGVIMVYSSSSIVAITKYAKYGYTSEHFFLSQLRAMAIGFLGLLVMLRIRYSFWKKRAIAFFAYVSTISLLILVLQFGATVNNAQSWIFGIQPAEFTKLAVIMVVARFYAKKHDLNTSYMQGVGGIGMYFLLVLFLIYKQPDLGTALLIASVIIVMTICCGVSVSRMLKRVFVTSPIWGALVYFGAKAKLTPEQVSRFTAFMDPFADPQGDGFHLINSFIAIASGGVQGEGLGNSIQKSGYLPEPHTDFIMAIVSEELGLLGVAIILVSLLVIVLRSFQIARKSRDSFASLLAIGIGSMIAIQSIVNIGGITGLLPLTGVPLPFISFGGSSLVVNLLSMGLLLNISACISEQEKQKDIVPQKPHLVVVK